LPTFLYFICERRERLRHFYLQVFKNKHFVIFLNSWFGWQQQVADRIFFRSQGFARKIKAEVGRKKQFSG
jgi:hypothetical protein